MSLQDEILTKSKEIQTDGYPMSIGELINMYRDEELIVNPEFQRFFRWTDSQKTKFIESILLGIPIPPIFVSQNENGVWDVIDGLQRLSTILEFVGILKDNSGNIVKASKLSGTKFLPSLQDKYWDSSNSDNSFTQAQRMDFKRSKLDIKIIKKASDKDAKYELFQRINTGGTSLEPQEIRNCLLIMIDKPFYDWCVKLNKYEPFQNCIPLTEKQYPEQYDMEITIRYLVYLYCDINNIRGNEDMNDFITNEIINIAENKIIDYDYEYNRFCDTFDYLNVLLEDDVFRKFNNDKSKFYGAFSVASFELIISGFSKNLDKIKLLNQDKIISLIKSIYNSSEYKTASNSSRPILRFKNLKLLGEKIFSDVN
ncbi:TPA: DUF262 domain-containing protein [Clostridioides difficile]|nr:DUF262 domain-containing protein [Clostridioides difficile]HBG5607522.1 DUF262 domain-containing protein [Clostridioides difficile]HCU2836635.1 DUF262 domain-containing protein [Clostridioides difficile]